jgi:hypothetical protein
MSCNKSIYVDQGRNGFSACYSSYFEEFLLLAGTIYTFKVLVGNQMDGVIDRWVLGNPALKNSAPLSLAD